MLYTTGKINFFWQIFVDFVLSQSGLVHLTVVNYNKRPGCSNNQIYFLFSLNLTSSRIMKNIFRQASISIMLQNGPVFVGFMQSDQPVMKQTNP